MVKGFKDKDGKFHPTEKPVVSEIQVKELPDSEIEKGIRDAKKLNLRPELVTKIKQEKERRIKVRVEEKEEELSAKKEIIPTAVFFNEGDIESVDYDFTKDGRIFYPKGFEKEILIEFNAKKLSEKEIEDLIKKSDAEFEKTRFDDDIKEDFLQEKLTDNTQFSESILDHDFRYGAVVTDENEEDERQYFIINETGETNVYDVTDLKGESVSGTGEPLEQIRDFIFPKPILLFKYQGEKNFAYDYVVEKVSIGFSQGSDEQVKELQEGKVSRINIVTDDFLQKNGKEPKQFFGNVGGR